MNIALPTFLSIQSVAARYDVTTSTIRRWEDGGKIPKAVTLHGRKRWKIEDLTAMERILIDNETFRTRKLADPDEAVKEFSNETRKSRAARAERRHR